LKIISNINKVIFLFISASTIIFIISGCADRNLPDNGVRLIDLIEPEENSMVVNFPIELIGHITVVQENMDLKSSMRI